jgi:uncharacterized protein DUF3379
MTCFEFRRLLLARPRELTPLQQGHAADCTSCAKAAEEAAALDMQRAQSVLVPPPEVLAEKILLRQKMGPRAHYGLWAMAATLVIGIGLGIQIYRSYDTPHENVNTATAVGTNHPAVAAISFVLDHEPRLLQENRSGDPNVMRTSFQRLGLKLPEEGVSVRYLGKCPVPGGTGDHVVLQTPYGQVTLILVPDYPVGSRVLVADRNMTALATPVQKGGYIVIAQSPQVIREIERMLAS